MKFSVIIPAYNSEATLARCLDSVLNQNFKDFEAIVVNDGSTDETGSIIETYSKKDSRIKGIHKENGGVSSARNAALDIASGEYIVFVDSDDIAESEWLETFSKDEQSDLCLQGMKVLYPDKVKILKINNNEHIHNPQCITGILISNNLLGYSPTKRFKNNIIKEHNIRFDTTIHFREDDLFVLNYIVHAQTLKCLRDVHYIYFAPENYNKYKSTEGDCTEKFFKSLESIYNNNIPNYILDKTTWSIKPHVIRLLLDNQIPSDYLLGLYKKYVKPNSTNYKSKIIDYIIIKSSKVPSISLFTIKTIHALISHK